eukprot:scaffold764_cov248-Pinguiococcus_pyrenoidosus.AAC.21
MEDVTSKGSRRSRVELEGWRARHWPSLAFHADDLHLGPSSADGTWCTSPIINVGPRDERRSFPLGRSPRQVPHHVFGICSAFFNLFLGGSSLMLGTYTREGEEGANTMA